MPRLIHLNGLPRVGKSTLARRYGDEHPGTLVLEIDLLAGMIGGWREDFFAVLPSARGHGRALAERHLRGGQDVVLPQLVTTHDRDLGFDAVARAAGASYVELALEVTEPAHHRRLFEKQPDNEVEARIQDLLSDPEGDLVERTRGHYADYLADRPRAIRLDTTGLTEDETYLALLDALASP